jgi:hypothetical protein
MTGNSHHSDQYTVSTHRFGTEAHVDDEGYLHTGRSQRQPDRVVIACGTTGVYR